MCLMTKADAAPARGSAYERGHVVEAGPGEIVLRLEADDAARPGALIDLIETAARLAACTSARGQRSSAWTNFTGANAAGPVTAHAECIECAAMGSVVEVTLRAGPCLIATATVSYR